jgi:hypothetical protein
MTTVIPAKAGIQLSTLRDDISHWIPAFAGMTDLAGFVHQIGL